MEQYQEISTGSTIEKLQFVGFQDLYPQKYFTQLLALNTLNDNIVKKFQLVCKDWARKRCLRVVFLLLTLLVEMKNIFI